jgi:hypothetical protein
MSNESQTLQGLFTDIADALRTRGNFSSTIKPIDFASTISSLSDSYDQANALVGRTISAYANGRVRLISNYAFAACSSLTEVSFDLCSAVYSYAFSNCVSLSAAHFPLAATIYIDAFKGCTALESLYLFIEPSTTNLNSSTFTGTPMSDSSYLGHYGSIFVPSALLSSYRSR